MTRKDDPYYDRIVYHVAGKINDEGQVSALCYSRPHPIPLARGQSWVMEAERATCARCRKIAKARDAVVA